MATVSVEIIYFVPQKIVIKNCDFIHSFVFKIKTQSSEKNRFSA